MEPAASPQRKSPMDEGERFAKLYDTIVETFRTYMTNFAWTVGLLSLANGWLLSSTSGRDFIRDSPLAYYSALLVTCAIGLLHTGACGMYYRRSQERIKQLATEYEDLHPLPFRDYEIRIPILVVNLLVSWTLVAGLIAFVVAAHRSSP